MIVTKQSIWKRTWQHHIVEHNPLGKNPGTSPSCAYNRDGKFCAIGCQVSPETSLKMEMQAEELFGGGVKYAASSWLFLNDVPKEDMDFFTALNSDDNLLEFAYSLQVDHDYSTDHEDYKKRLEKTKCLI